MASIHCLQQQQNNLLHEKNQTCETRKAYPPQPSVEGCDTRLPEVERFGLYSK